MRRFGSRALAGAFAVTLIAFGSDRVPATAQSSTPQRVRLVRRGKVGDSYQYLYSGCATDALDFDVKMENSLLNGDHPSSDVDIQTHVATELVKAVGASGDITVELSTPEYFVVETEDGGTKRLPNAEQRDLVVYRPDDSEVSRKTLLTVKPKIDPDEDQIERWLSGGAFPTKTLTVGDKFEGDFDAHLDIGDPLKRPTPVHFQGTLVGVETRQGIRCARLEYTANLGKSFLDAMVRQFSGALPGKKDIVGTPTTDGKAIVFLSLDRGALIEYSMDISIMFDCKATLTAANGNPLGTVTLKGPMRMTGSCIATAAPAFDPAMVSSPNQGLRARP